MTQLFELKPRWPGAPPLCIAANLPAFESKAEALEFQRTHAPGNSILKVGRCRVCGMWHYTSILRGHEKHANQFEKIREGL